MERYFRLKNKFDYKGWKWEGTDASAQNIWALLNETDPNVTGYYTVTYTNPTTSSKFASFATGQGQIVVAENELIFKTPHGNYFTGSEAYAQANFEEG